jgi:hypothetical protein
MLKRDQPLSQDNLNKSFLSKTNTGTQYILGNLNMIGNITINGSITMNGNIVMNGPLNMNNTIMFGDTTKYLFTTASDTGMYWDATTDFLHFHQAGISKFYVNLAGGNSKFMGSLDVDGTTIKVANKFAIQYNSTNETLDFLYIP